MNDTPAYPDAPSRKLAQFAVGLRLADVPAPVRDRAKLHILDGLGLGLASTTFEYGRSSVAVMPWQLAQFCANKEAPRVRSGALLGARGTG